MEIVIVSKENNILHISNQEYKIDYSFYDREGHLIDGGDDSRGNEPYNTDEVITELISTFKDKIDFSEPFVFITGEKAEDYLELIENEEYENMLKKVETLRVSNNKDEIDKDEREIE